MLSNLLPPLEGISLSCRRVSFPRDLPDLGLTLVIGFTHAARHDVGAWKAALAERGVPFLSLPTAAMDGEAHEIESVAQAMRQHVPPDAWGQVIQVHRGGEALIRVFSWQIDVFAKVLHVRGDGAVLARHDAGPFSRESLARFLG